MLTEMADGDPLASPHAAVALVAALVLGPSLGRGGQALLGVLLLLYLQVPHVGRGIALYLQLPHVLPHAEIQLSTYMSDTSTYRRSRRSMRRRSAADSSCTR